MPATTMSDTDLVLRARAGDAGAFAVLLHRHGHAVRAVVADDRDPTAATVATFVAAMRALPDRDPQAPVRPWLLDLAAARTRRPAVDDVDDAPPLDDDERDAVWAALARRWPDGRPPRRLPGWVGWAATVVALVALGVLVPYAVIGLSDRGAAATTQELLAVPYDDAREEPVAQEEASEPADEDLDAFTFPEILVDGTSTDDPGPTLDVEPEPTPAAEADATPTPEPVPAPAPEPTPAPAPAPAPPPAPTPAPTPDPAPDPEPTPEPDADAQPDPPAEPPATGDDA